MQWLADMAPVLGTVLTWLGGAGLFLFALPLLVLFGLHRIIEIARQISVLIDQVSGAALAMAMTMAVLMVFTQLAVVLARHVYGLAFSWLNETVLYAFAAMFLLAAAGALRDDAHVRVDILRPRFGPTGQAWIELVGAYFLVLPICLLIFWAAAPGLSISWANLEGSRESDGLPLLFLFKTLIPVFATLLAAQGLSEAIKAALNLRNIAITQGSAD